MPLSRIPQDCKELLLHKSLTICHECACMSADQTNDTIVFSCSEQNVALPAGSTTVVTIVTWQKILHETLTVLSSAMWSASNVQVQQIETW